MNNQETISNIIQKDSVNNDLKVDNEKRLSTP